jgi:insulysin
MYKTYYPIKYINDHRTIKGYTLNNNINVILISDEKIKYSSCCTGVNSGSFNDIICGTAHFIEHLLFMGNEKYPDKFEFMNYITSHDGSTNALTTSTSTLYYIEINKNNIEKAIDMLSSFFINPLLKNENIKSESEVINSEHSKNKSSIGWIINFLTQKFIKNNCYNKFSTGNTDTLQNITHQDLLDYFIKHYTSNNLCVCITDSTNIEYMEKNYIPYFENIKESYSNNSITEKIQLIDENCIYYELDTSYKFLNIIFFLPYDHTHENYQIIELIIFLIVSKYENSIYDNLKHLIYDISCFYDIYSDSILLNINYILKFNNSTDEIINTTLNFFKYLNSVDIDTFELLYNRRKNILELQRENLNIDNQTLDIVSNYFMSNKYLCIEKKYVFDNFDSSMFSYFKSLLNYSSYKILTNSVNLKTESIIKSDLYNVKYNIFTYQINNLNNNYTFNPLKSMLDISIDINYIKPENFNDNIIRDTHNENYYKVNYNKYNKNITYISIIKKNNNLLNYEFRLMFMLYLMIFNKILNYTISLYSEYDTFIKIESCEDYYTIDIIGVDDLIIDFTNIILKNINIFNADNEKFFDEINNELILKYNNFYYDSVINICNLKFVNNLYNTNIETIVNFLKSLTFEDLKNNYDLYFGCQSYKIISIGKINISSINFDCLLNKQNLYELNIKYKNCNDNSISDENCVQYYYLYKLSLDNIESVIKLDIMTTIIKIILNKLLFNYLRTTKKLGYIVSCNKNMMIVNDKIYIYIIYLVQSTKKIDILIDNINKFNELLKRDIVNNTFETNFINIKNSLLKKYNKMFVNIEDEMYFYKNNIIMNNYDFDVMKKYNILQRITFEEFNKVFIDLFKVYNFIICDK